MYYVFVLQKPRVIHGVCTVYKMKHLDMLISSSPDQELIHTIQNHNSIYSYVHSIILGFILFLFLLLHGQCVSSLGSFKFHLINLTL